MELKVAIAAGLAGLAVAALIPVAAGVRIAFWACDRRQRRLDKSSDTS